MSENILKMEGISKSFPGVKALDNVDFALRKGDIHALVGENGAGKSTLIKVITGVYEKDAGRIALNGRPIHFKFRSCSSMLIRRPDRLVCMSPKHRYLYELTFAL